MALQDKAKFLERYLVSPALYRKAPANLQRIVEQEKDGGPIGLAYNEGMWYVLCSGQGPFIAEMEPGNDPNVTV